MHVNNNIIHKISRDQDVEKQGKIYTWLTFDASGKSMSSLGVSSRVRTVSTTSISVVVPSHVLSSQDARSF